MGSCCPGGGDAAAVQRSTNMYEAPKGDEADLSAPSTFGVSDKYRIFELSTPFARININTFCVYVKMAQTDCGDDGFVTLKAMRTHFKTDAWKCLEDENSTVSKFLLSSAFKGDGHASDQIDT